MDESRQLFTLIRDLDTRISHRDNFYLSVALGAVNPLLAYWTRLTDLNTIRIEEVQSVFSGLEEVISALRENRPVEALIMELTSQSDPHLRGLAQIGSEQYRGFKSRFGYSLPEQKLQEAVKTDRLKGVPLSHLVLDKLYLSRRPTIDVLRQCGAALTQETYQDGLIRGEQNIYRANHNQLISSFKR